jgi:hypothetical protein
MISLQEWVGQLSLFDSPYFSLRAWRLVMRKLFVRSIVAMVLFACASRADAIGWDSNDFLIGGGPSFNNKIGVFDHDLSFKGLLDAGFLGVGGLAFDANGRLVASSFALREVRVYESSGVQVGGFIDEALASSGNLRIAPDGSYIIGQSGTATQGALQFKDSGEFVRQYGDGDMARIAIVASNRLWSGRLGSSSIRTFDVETGTEAQPILVAGLNGVSAISYRPSSDTVIIGNSLTSSLLETDLNGNVVRSFLAPATASFRDIASGPNGDVFASAATSAGEGILQWRSDGTFVREVSVAATLSHAAGLAWAGNVPEPSFVALNLIIGFAISGTRLGRRRFCQR